MTGAGSLRWDAGGGIRVLEAAVIGSFWALAWGAVGALIGATSRFPDELWLGPPIGMSPGFLSGVIFFAILVIAGRRRRLDESSPSAVVASGGVAGMLVGMLPFVINPAKPGVPLWVVASVVVGSMTFLGALSGAGSLALARIGKSAGRRRS